MKASWQHRRQCQGERGYVLLGVVLTLLMAAAISYQLSRESALNVNAAGSEAQALQARYVAESGLAYAAARLNAGGACTGIAAGAPVTGQIGADSFSVTGTTVGINPLTLELTSTPTLAATGTAFAPLTKRVVVYTRVEQQTTVYRAAAGTGTVADTFIAKGLGGFSGANAYNFGADPVLVLDNGGKVSNMLFRFELAGALPAGAKLKTAQFVLATGPSWGTTGDRSDVTAHEVTRAWNEGSGSFSTPLQVSSGPTWDQVLPGTAWGFVRYMAAGNSTSNLASGGGDYDPAYVDRQYINAAAVAPSYTWDVTPLAAQWIANPAGNFGLLLKAEQNLSQAKFVGSEDPSRTKRPQLVLTYLTPCGGPSIALSVLDITTAKPILVATVNTPVRLRIDIANSAAVSASVSTALTIALPPNSSVANPAGASVASCGGMTFAPLPGDTTLTLLGGSIPAASGTAPGACNVSVAVSVAQPSGSATLASGPAGTPTTFTVAAGQLSTSQGSNVGGATTSLYAVPLPTLAADTYLSASNQSVNYGPQSATEQRNNSSLRTLLRFTALPPVGAPVQSATLRVFLRSIGSPSLTANITIQPYLVTTFWSEGAAMWVKTGGADWNNNGGDYITSPAPPATTLTPLTIPSPLLGMWLSFDVSLLANAWGGGVANYGLILVNTTPATPGQDNLSLDSRERAGGNRAQLQITY